MELWDCRHLLFFYAFVDIAIRLFDTDLSLQRFSVSKLNRRKSWLWLRTLFVQNF